MSTDNFWNLPRPVAQPRYDFLEALFWDYFQNRPIKILEVGVHKGDMFRRLLQSRLHVARYDGIDPYLGSTGDYYLGGYWKDRESADDLFREVQAEFATHGHALHRRTSEEFFRESVETYDLIYVDGDHRFGPALWDLAHWPTRLSPEALLVVDDYASVDHPEVTRAVNTFLDLFEPHIERMGYRSYEMYLGAGTKRIPISKTNAYFRFRFPPDKAELARLAAIADDRAAKTPSPSTSAPVPERK